MSSSSVKIIFGGGGMGRYTTEVNQQFLDILEKHGVKDIDTAYIYVSTLKSI
jgi:hypothetical protein